MSHDFSSLSDADFEDLAREVVGKELGIRFEAFGPGPDGGIDGRHALGSSKTILQAKHYLRSSISSLIKVAREEAKKLKAHIPSRYLFATSKSLTPTSKAKIAAALSPILKSESDIFGQEDLNGMLGRHPEIEKAHIKLWLSRTAVLERILRSSAFNFTATARTDIEAKVKIYVPNPSLKEARDKLESHHVLIVAGPPGVGKTTLAEMLAYAYIGEEWTFVPIRDLNDGFAEISDAKKLLYFFDDFLGTSALDSKALAAKDSELSRFINRIRRTKNARFILTTRAYILEEARRISEHLADDKVDMSKYILDVGIYTRRIKARILYNHLLVSGTPQQYIRSLINSGKLSDIIDHKNYNPRIIEWMTDPQRISEINSSLYPTRFLDVLTNPKKLWDTAFRTHISKRCQNLLYCMYFCSEYGADIEDVRSAFDNLHPLLSRKYGHPFDPKDFQESVKTLEGSFINIIGTRLSFINPSVRDYLSDYLNDRVMLREFAAAAPNTLWASSIERKFMEIPDVTPSERAAFINAFIPLSSRITEVSVWLDSSHGFRRFDASNSDRIETLVRWWRISLNDLFLDRAIALISDQKTIFYHWSDAKKLTSIYVDLMKRKSERTKVATLVPLVTSKVCELLERNLDINDVENVEKAIDSGGSGVPLEIISAHKRAVERVIEQVPLMMPNVDSESELSDHRKSVERLVGRYKVEDASATLAFDAIDERRTTLESMSILDEPQFSADSVNVSVDQFDDREIENLFATLIIDN